MDKDNITHPVYKRCTAYRSIIMRNASSYSDKQSELLDQIYSTLSGMAHDLSSDAAPVTDYDMGRAIAAVDSIGQAAVDLLVAFELKK